MSAPCLAAITQGVTLTNPGTVETIFPNVTGGSTRLLLGPRSRGCTSNVYSYNAGRDLTRAVRIRCGVLVTTGVTSTATLNVAGDTALATDLTTLEASPPNVGIGAYGSLTAGSYYGLIVVDLMFVRESAGSDHTLAYYHFTGPNSFTTDTAAALDGWLGSTTVDVATGGFYVSVTFGTANAGNKATLCEFAMDQL